MIQIVLLRHGKSQWNHEHRFTGWTDVGMTPTGVEESRRAGRQLAAAGFRCDCCFTSLLQRGVLAARATLEGMGQPDAPLRQTWRLNERHFGALQGMDRWQAVRTFGPLHVLRIQRSYTLRPPPLAPGDPRAPALDPLYKDIPARELPLTESLADTHARVIPYWEEVILRQARPGARLLLVAHKNSLRVLMKHVEGFSEAETPRLHIATGDPLVYEFDDAMCFLRRRHLSPIRRRKFSIWTGISPA